MARVVYRQLKKFVEDGFLLHGSNKKFDVIKPNRKEKIDPRAGLIKAVYATNDPLMAMFIAILKPQKLPIINGRHKCMKSWGYDEDGTLRFWLTPNFNIHDAYDIGWVYVAESNLFTALKKLPHEFYSRNEVTPKHIVEVNPKDFLSIAKIELLTADDIREAGFHTEEEITLMGYD